MSADEFRSNGGSSLEVLLDLGRVLSVEPLEFLVELHVPFVDEVDVSVLVVHPPPAVLGLLGDPVGRNIFNYKVIL